MPASVVGIAVTGDAQPLVQEGEVADSRAPASLTCSTRWLCSEWKTWWIGGQADVLVAAAVAGDVVGVEQLVVVGSLLAAVVDETGRRAVSVRIASGIVAVLLEDAADDDGHGRMGDVVEEGVAGAAPRLAGLDRSSAGVAR